MRRSHLCLLLLVAAPAVCLAKSSSSASQKNNGMMAVEPYLGEWCAKQFRPQLANFSGFDMARLLTHHVKIEPFLGEWCFDQFPQYLAILDRSRSFSDLQSSHIPIEQFLRHWSQRSLANLQQQQLDTTQQDDDGIPTVATPSQDAAILVDIEPYLGEWCVWQYPHHLKRIEHTVFQDVAETHIKLEPILARWCFAQFPQQLDGLNNPHVIGEIFQHHESVENQLLQWSLTNINNMATTTTTESSSSANNAAVVVLSLALAGCFAALVAVLFLQQQGATSLLPWNNQNEKTTTTRSYNRRATTQWIDGGEARRCEDPSENEVDSSIVLVQEGPETAPESSSHNDERIVPPIS
ncbi:expressed unknown protein [Seminavis robusta]|uniref:Uncharacterized protein n=1 Tax=Seminavis robusta TaxID=568900 RepID=A0A9N8EHG2_9STRA|nr:expressed unknown protein [Seminavis robusta]|eukprot:Sro1139_g245440.1 n/a (352) ;mRNA; f:14156-15211